MGQSYRQLTADERCEIARRRSAGETIRQVAAALDRSPSSISREVRRNAPAGTAYKPAYAGDQAQARRWRGSKLERNLGLQQQVLEGLGQGWSPEQVCGRLQLEAGRQLISHESIYRFIAAQIRRTKDYSWRLYLPRAKAKRGLRGKKGGSSALRIKERISLDNRPAEAADRSQPGHWEGDFMAFSIYGQNLLAAHERSTRMTLIARQSTKHAEPVADTLQRWLKPLPARLRRTITFDNGTEFASHHQLRDQLGIQTFFCDPYAPWQKGGVENAIGRLRRLLPRNTDLNSLQPEQIIACVRRYNHTPRRCLGFRTPAEAFTHLLHLECESTSPPSRG
jgi:transposase, IS30 family